MNIGLFTDCYLPTKNGVSTAITQVQDELEHRGHKVVVLTVEYPTNDPARCRNRGFSQFLTSSIRLANLAGGGPIASSSDLGDRLYRVPSLPFRSDIELRVGLARQIVVNRIVAREKLDLIHTHTEFALGWAGKRAARDAGLPLIHTLHTFYPEYRHYLPLGRLLPDRAINGFLARFLDGYDALLCPSEKIKTYVASFRPGIRTAVIGNGSSGARFDLGQVTEADRDRVRAGLGISPADRVILYVGRLAPEKRVLPLLAALQPLLQADAGCRAVFVGAGPAQDRLAAAARAAGLAQQVVLAGPVAWERMAEIYAVAHVFVNASLSEVHPMTLLEALLCGLPIVARRDVSLRDLVLDGVNGFLVDSDSEMAGNLAALLKNDITRRTFAANARLLATQFTVGAHVDRLETLYRQLVESRLRKASP